ncbi:GIY-YIG nuclease family protein [Chondrinema litorale]|uniref:GIY-YIG nuclease family protein n=1 Tax=Chondrinema litorale TaxID=2994555 RepID=UPI0025427D93|nr:GIY-YIG nuclease family protein [Chondrinema litorale]UZR93726.1 GIY-YIG nuclease family protein [Chondrinema litorale]
MHQFHRGKCVYIIKTGKLFKIGKTKDLHERLAAYRTHLPAEFKVIRQYLADNMDEVEQSLHVLFQHKRVKGEWFELKQDDLTICDNIVRSYAIAKLNKSTKSYKKLRFINNPQMQVQEANEKYLKDYAKIAEELKLGMSTEEIFEQHHGEINKSTIQTVRKILEYQTPNSEYMVKWAFIVEDLERGLTLDEIYSKYEQKVSKLTIRTIRRILRNQLF